MNTILIFLLGMAAGGLISFFSLIYFTERMDEKQRKEQIEKSRDKREIVEDVA